MFLAQESSNYILRWPSWVGGVIGIGIMSAIYAAAAEGVRRALGLRAVWIVAILASIGMGAYLVSVITSEVPPREQFILWIALAYTLVVMFLAPAYGISVGARRPDSSLGRQIGFGVSASYAVALGGFMLGAVATVIFRFIK